MSLSEEEILSLKGIEEILNDSKEEFSPEISEEEILKEVLTSGFIWWES